MSNENQNIEGKESAEAKESGAGFEDLNGKIAEVREAAKNESLEYASTSEAFTEAFSKKFGAGAGPEAASKLVDDLAAEFRLLGEEAQVVYSDMESALAAAAERTISLKPLKSEVTELKISPQSQNEITRLEGLAQMSKLSKTMKGVADTKMTPRPLMPEGPTVASEVLKTKTVEDMGKFRKMINLSESLKKISDEDEDEDEPYGGFGAPSELQQNRAKEVGEQYQKEKLRDSAAKNRQKTIKLGSADIQESFEDTRLGAEEPTTAKKAPKLPPEQA